MSKLAVNSKTCIKLVKGDNVEIKGAIMKIMSLRPKATEMYQTGL